MQKKYASLGLLTLLLSASVHAQNGIYVTADGGFANQSGLPDVQTAGALSLDNSRSLNAMRFGVGYNHDLNQLFGIGLDIGTGRYGDATYQYADRMTTKVYSSTLEFLMTGTLHLQQTDLFAKAGGLRLTPKVSGMNAPEEDTQIRLEAALGAAYNFTPHFAATLTYAHVFGSQVETIAQLGAQTPSLNEALLGFRYTFGS